MLSSLFNSDSTNKTDNNFIMINEGNISANVSTINAEKFDQVFKFFTMRSDRKKLALLFYENIHSVSENTFFEIVMSGDEFEEKMGFMEAYLPKVEKLSIATIKKIYHDLYVSTYKANFVLKYKDLIAKLCVDPTEFLKDIKSKTERNAVRHALNLPLENIEDRGEGFEIYGQFKKYDEFELNKKYEFQSQKTRSFITKYRNDNQFEVEHERSLTSFGGHSSTGMRFTGVWIIDDTGLYSE
jgi:hypothetical protein